MVRLGLDWINWFAGLSSSQVVSVIIVFVIFTVAAGVVLLSLILFGVRSGLMAPAYSRQVPIGSDLELGAFLLAAAAAMLAILIMVFLGLAENMIGAPISLANFNPLLLFSIVLILVAGLLMLGGVGLAFRTVRRRHVVRAS